MITNEQVSENYLSTQGQRYREFVAQGQTSSALDALWRGASAADLLTREEYRSSALSSARIADLLIKLGWMR